MTPALSKEFLDIQANYEVWILSETRTRHDNNIQLEILLMFPLVMIFWVMSNLEYRSHEQSCYHDIFPQCLLSILPMHDTV